MPEAVDHVPKVTERRLQQVLYRRHRGNARMILPNYTPWRWYECDLFVITAANFTIEYEAKLTRTDFAADQRKRLKHKILRERKSHGFMPTRFFYVMPEGLVSASEIPDYAGLVYVKACPGWPPFREHVAREAPRLSTEKVPDQIQKHARRNMYYKFWNERHRFDEYRDRIEREEADDAKS